MGEIIIMTDSRDRFSSLVKGLRARSDCQVGWDSSIARIQDRVSETLPDLIVIDEDVDGNSNLEIARQIVMTNAMVNLALVSSLSPGDFHEASEGLGIVAQVPPHPGEEDARRLLEAIQSIASLTAPA